MLRLILRLIFLIWLAVTLCFFVLRLLPGDAIEAQFALTANPAAAELKRQALGLDTPVMTQYLRYMTGLLQGDAGVSLYSGQTVTEMLVQRFPKTAELVFWSMLIAIITGLWAGVMGGLPGNRFRRVINPVVNLIFSIPVYWTATLILFVIGVYTGGVRNHVLLAAFVPGIHTAAAIARVVRTGVEDTVHQDFVRTAYSKGLPDYIILYRHILRASLAPAVSLIALQTGVLFSGTVITESIFQRSGIGLLLLDSVLARDYPVVQGVVICMATLYLIMNGFADILARVIDPRVKA